MKTILQPRRQRASTMTDVLIVIATIALLAGVFLPRLTRPKRGPCRINCINNVKQIALGFRIWSNDNGDRFPWAVPASEGGTLEQAASPEVFRHFQVASEEFSTPKILACSQDRGRTKATDWSLFSNSNLSYFIGLTSDENDPQSILSGDRNLMTNGVVLGSGVFQLTTNNMMSWTKEMHKHVGNVGLADGSVQQVSVAALQIQWLASTNAARRLAIP